VRDSHSGWDWETVKEKARLKVMVKLTAMAKVRVWGKVMVRVTASGLAIRR
jgi:hypothetical protein